MLSIIIFFAWNFFTYSIRLFELTASSEQTRNLKINEVATVVFAFTPRFTLSGPFITRWMDSSRSMRQNFPLALCLSAWFLCLSTCRCWDRLHFVLLYPTKIVLPAFSLMASESAWWFWYISEGGEGPTGAGLPPFATTYSFLVTKLSRMRPSDSQWYLYRLLQSWDFLISILICLLGIEELYAMMFDEADA